MDTNASIYPAIAIVGQTPYVAWYEWNSIAQQVYVKHLIGSTWTLDGTSLNKFTNRNAQYPSIGVLGTTPYVTWQELDPLISQVWVKQLIGSNWVPVGLSSLNRVNTQPATKPRIAFGGTTPFVTWSESNGTNNLIYVAQYDGSNWTTVGPTAWNTVLTANADNPAIAMTANGPCVTWQESGKVYVKQYDVSANDWVPMGSHMNIVAGYIANDPDITVIGTAPYVTWTENEVGVTKVYVRRNLGGTTWTGLNGALNMDPSRSAFRPRITSADGRPVVTWYESNGSNDQVYAKVWNSPVWQLLGPGSINVDTASWGGAPMGAYSGQKYYVTWHEGSGSSYKVFVKHFETATVTPTTTPTATMTPTMTATPAQTASLTTTITPSLTITPTLTITSTVIGPQTGSPTSVMNSPVKGVSLRPNILRAAAGPIQIRLNLLPPEQVKLVIYSRGGDKIKTITEQRITSLQFDTTWDGTNDQGKPVQAGVYLLLVETEHWKQKEKLVVVR